LLKSIGDDNSGMTDFLDGVATLAHLGVIRVEGDDAVTFLQGQLTQDFALLGNGQARLAAYCTAKGRMQASFIGIKRGPSDVLLVMSRDILPATLKRLSMFVLRAKAKLRDATADFGLFGLAGSPARVPGLDDAPWSVVESDGAEFVRLYPADGTPRAMAVLPAAAPQPSGQALELARWQWGDVRSGIATVSTPVLEQFVPQMLNFESVGGVNFKKGCYPGQEVVARSQFRGTLKRRAWLAHADAPLAAGQEVFHALDPSQPAGVVVQAAEAPAGGWDAIVSIQLVATDGGALAAGAADGPPLTLQPPPYPLLADI
jgi:folate-binding protein YgfZ